MTRSQLYAKRSVMMVELTNDDVCGGRRGATRFVSYFFSYYEERVLLQRRDGFVCLNSSHAPRDDCAAILAATRGAGMNLYSGYLNE